MSPISVVEYPILPAASDLTFSRVILITASSMAFAAADSPRKSSIICPAQMAASGLITFCPVYFGALQFISFQILRWAIHSPETDRLRIASVNEIAPLDANCAMFTGELFVQHTQVNG